MTERRSSISLRHTANAYSTPKGRARSAERSMRNVLDEDDFQGKMEVANGEEQAPPTRNRLGSDSSAVSKVLGLRRANSDPFENAGEEETSEDHHAKASAPTPSNKHRRQSLVEEENSALPTFTRFPYADSKNRNCWSEPPHETFSVRGRNYLKDKKKITAKDYLLQARGSDLFLSDQPATVDMGTLKGALGGNFRKKPTFVVRFTFPWGLLVQYYEVPAALRPFLRMHGTTQGSINSNLTKGFSSGQKALAKWFAGDEDYKNDRLKLIAFVPEGPWIVR